MHLGPKQALCAHREGKPLLWYLLSTKLHSVTSRNIDTQHRENPVSGVCFLFSFTTDICNRQDAIPLLKADKGQIYYYLHDLRVW